MEIVSDVANEPDVMKKMEDEHLRLQREVRMIQIDRMHRIAGVHPLFRPQDKLLRMLKKEYLNLVKDLKIARSGAHKKKDKRMKVDLKRALLLREEIEMDAEGGITLMNQLDDLLQRNNKNTLQLRKVVNSKMGQLKERRIQSESRLVSTENNLEIANMRFNAVQCENKKIREEIEHMLKDRANFNQAWWKMLAALGKGKKFLTDLFESSTIAYNQRDEWCSKLKSTQEKGKMDLVLQLQEMRDLQKNFDHEMKLYRFLAKKGVMRINEKQEEREKQQKEKEEEDVLKKIKEHQHILNEIQDYTEVEDIEKIIDDFEKKEHTNFSIYKLLTDYCAENETLRRDLNKVRQELLDRRDWNEMMEATRQDHLDKLRTQLEEQKRRTDSVRAKVAEKQGILQDNMEKIEGLFKMLECSLEPFENLLGDKKPSLWQLNLSLLLITEKIKEYIQLVYYSERITSKRSALSGSRLKRYTVHADTPQPLQPVPINLMVPADPCPVCIEARWLSRVCDQPELPFDRAATLAAIEQLRVEPSYERSDRLHALNVCRANRSRNILAAKYMDELTFSFLKK